MKKILSFALALLGAAALAQQPVQREGYVRKDGVYVPPSMATAPNDTKLDNYSTKGNINPYTGKAGTVDPYKVEPIKPLQHQQSVPAIQPLKPIEPIKPLKF